MHLKVLVFVGIIGIAHSLPVLVEAKALEVGASTQYKTEDNHGNYAFGYSEDSTSGGSFRKEFGDSLGNKVGSYGLHNADGRTRVVNYIADSAGFRADVHTNEPGVDGSQDSAHVAVNKPAVVATSVVAPAPAVVAHAPAVVAHAPAVVAPAVVAPTVAVAHHTVPLFHPPLLHSPFTYTTLLGHGPHIIL